MWCIIRSSESTIRLLLESRLCSQTLLSRRTNSKNRRIINNRLQSARQTDAVVCRVVSNALLTPADLYSFTWRQHSRNSINPRNRATLEKCILRVVWYTFTCDEFEVANWARTLGGVHVHSVADLVHGQGDDRGGDSHQHWNNRHAFRKEWDMIILKMRTDPLPSKLQLRDQTAAESEWGLVPLSEISLSGRPFWCHLQGFFRIVFTYQPPPPNKPHARTYFEFVPYILQNKTTQYNMNRYIVSVYKCFRVFVKCHKKTMGGTIFFSKQNIPVTNSSK